MADRDQLLEWVKEHPDEAKQVAETWIFVMKRLRELERIQPAD